MKWHPLLLQQGMVRKPSELLQTTASAVQQDPVQDQLEPRLLLVQQLCTQYEQQQYTITLLKMSYTVVQ